MFLLSPIIELGSKSTLLGSHWSWINAMKNTSIVKRSFLIKKHMAHWRINIRIRLSFICSKFLFQSSFLWLNNFFLINVICFKLLLLMVKIQKQVFLTAAEKQPIVSSKQPIVLSLTALWRNYFNCYFEFLSVADQFKRENLGQRICVESWLCSERSYKSHKGIYSKILEIQEP